MRKLAGLLIVLGLAGLVLGGIVIVRVALASGTAPFSFENYGGPGPMLGALVLLLGGLYLFSSARRED
jgi:hypothetical protein